MPTTLPTIQMREMFPGTWVPITDRDLVNAHFNKTEVKIRYSDYNIMWFDEKEYIRISNSPQPPLIK